jgi:hypothetical protein
MKQMKKMKHISDLREEKMRLRIRQLELEKELRLSWHDLKQSLRPATFLSNKLADMTGSRIKKDDLFSTTISHGAAYLTRQFATAAGDQIASRVQTGIEHLAGKIKNVFRKRK